MSSLAVVLALGACGSGKTHALQQLARHELTRARSAWRMLVLDLNDEWPGAAGGQAGAVKRPESALDALDRYRMVLVRPGSVADLPELGEQLAAVAVRSRHPVVLVVPEVHLVVPEGYPVRPSVKTILHRHRHPSTRAALWADTQSFRDVSKELVNACTWLVACASASNDLDVWRRMGGRALVEQLERAGELAAKKQPGWCVGFAPLNARGPFILRRGFP